MTQNEPIYCTASYLCILLKNTFSECTCKKKLCRMVQAMIFLFCGKGGSRSVGKIMDTNNIIM